MLGVSVAALLGVFGGGPLANAHAGSETLGLRVDYERFLRQEAPGTLTVYLGGAAVRPDSMTELWLDRKWLADMEVTGITPEPERSRVETDRIVYTFRLNPESTPVRVTWYFETHLFGPSTGRIGVVGGPSYSFSQFAYP